MKRAERRHHKHRMVDRATSFIRRWGFSPKDVRHKAVRLADNCAPCSCEGCGNPRRHTGHRTIQERRHDTSEVTDANVW
jgi:hypothetical protein